MCAARRAFPPSAKEEERRSRLEEIEEWKKVADYDVRARAIRAAYVLVQQAADLPDQEKQQIAVLKLVDVWWEKMSGFTKAVLKLKQFWEKRGYVVYELKIAWREDVVKVDLVTPTGDPSQSVSHSHRVY